MKPALDLSESILRKNTNGKWRFFYFDKVRPFEEVDTLDEQRMLFCRGSGEKETWTAENKLYAKTWAACVAEVWKDPENQTIQRKYTADRLSRFLRPAAHQVFLNMNVEGSPVLEASYAAYLSFAVNNPTRAEKHLLIALNRWNGGYEGTWLDVMLKELTYGPGIAIYPARYHAIKPVLEKLYDVKLFEGVGEISEWMVRHAIKPMDVREAQELLINAGYDLGPWGADGKFGKKTKAAICALQHSCGLLQTGLLDSKTCEWLRSVQHP